LTGREIGLQSTIDSRTLAFASSATGPKDTQRQLSVGHRRDLADLEVRPMTPEQLKKLREDRALVAGVIREMANLVNDEQRDFTAEEQEKWEKANADYNLQTRQIEVGERDLQLQADEVAGANNPAGRIGRGDHGEQRTPARVQNAAGPSRETRDLGLRAWFGTQLGLDIPDAWREAARECRIRPDAQVLDLPLLCTSDLRSSWQGNPVEMRITTSATEGAELIPEGFMPRLEKALLLFGGVRQVAEIIRTDMGNALPWPTVDETAVKGRKVAEEAAVTATDVTFSSLTLNAYKYSSDLVLVSAEVIEDSAIDVATIVADLLGERLGRILNQEFTVGDGTGDPNGIVTAAAAGITSGGAGAIDEDDIIDMIHSVDPAYRTTARWMMNDAIVAEVRKFKDTNGQFLWQPSLQLGRPDFLAGYPITINQDMSSSVATTEIVALFGDLSKYKVREVRGIRLRRLVERYADNDQEGFVAFMRADGDLLDAGSGPVKKLTVQ
jgi:HK97 family phage major capsid protein